MSGKRKPPHLSRLKITTSPIEASVVFTDSHAVSMVAAVVARESWPSIAFDALSEEVAALLKDALWSSMLVPTPAGGAQHSSAKLPAKNTASSLIAGGFFR